MMTNLISSSIEHKAALPYCYYDSTTKTIVLRVITTGEQASGEQEIGALKLIYGDPHEWEKGAERVYVWRFQEKPLYPQSIGASKTVWQVEIPLPQQRRLKYAFLIKTASGDWYFSENGLEPSSSEAVNRPHNHFFYPFIYESEAPSQPAWVEQTVWYQIFPERFCKGKPALSQSALEDWETGTNYRSFFGGDLSGIIQKLPYLTQLGITGIYLTPVFQAPSAHKYDTQDYFTVDEQFGTLSDLKELVAQAHSKGIKIMLDAVFNHCGETHPFWQDVLKNQECSVYRNYFYIQSFPVKERYAAHEKVPYATFGFTRMPKWNTENPQVRSYLLEVSAYWIRECDLDGWRLDVANEVSLEFWHDFSHQVRTLKKDFYITGEVWHDASNWINRRLFDAAMNYPLGALIVDYFIKKTVSATQFSDRLITLLARYSDLHNRLAFNLFDSHDTDRILTRAGGDKVAVRNAFTLLFLLPGSPCLYYGTEIGMEGGQDPDNRRPMVWDEAKQDKDLFQFFQRLIALRKKYHDLIVSGTLEYVPLESLHCWRIANAKQSLRLVYAEAERVPLSVHDETVVFTTGDDSSGLFMPYTLKVYHSAHSAHKS
ncbi:MAG: glycoside hydrolase family 13 protein [Spirochaetaceae bacterium]|jgi:glycosidase|nr:glycoside hydrolase family 13 protein [Spirochaetaceae bacterium]